MSHAKSKNQLLARGRPVISGELDAKQFLPEQCKDFCGVGGQGTIKASGSKCRQSFRITREKVGGTIEHRDGIPKRKRAQGIGVGKSPR